MFLIALGCSLAALGQADVAVEILQTGNAGEIAPVDPDGHADRPVSLDEYVSCLTYMNPLNSADVMAQWTVIDSLFRTNNIRIGVTMCSIGCGASIHVDDIERARLIMETAIRDQLIDNSILKMGIAVPSIPENAPQGVAFSEP